MALRPAELIEVIWQKALAAAWLQTRARANPLKIIGQLDQNHLAVARKPATLGLIKSLSEKSLLVCKSVF